MQFEVTTTRTTDGGGKAFREYRILMIDAGGVVGIEDGPRRDTVTALAARRAAKDRISILRSHRLFGIRVSKKHIEDGEARNCHTCAISQALWHAQDSMGLSRSLYSFEVSPYACFVEARGLVLSKKYGSEISQIPEDEMPDLVTGVQGNRVFTESMCEWAMSFDDWAESRYIPVREWREMHGYRDGETPWRPSPASFVLDLDAMKPFED